MNSKGNLSITASTITTIDTPLERSSDCASITNTCSTTQNRLKRLRYFVLQWVKEVTGCEPKETSQSFLACGAAMKFVLPRVNSLAAPCHHFLLNHLVRKPTVRQKIQLWDFQWKYSPLAKEELPKNRTKHLLKWRRYFDVTQHTGLVMDSQTLTQLISQLPQPMLGRFSCEAAHMHSTMFRVTIAMQWVSGHNSHSSITCEIEQLGYFKPGCSNVISFPILKKVSGFRS